MTRRLGLVAVGAALVLAVVLWLWLRSPNVARVTPPQTTPMALLTGQVLDGATGRGIAWADVTAHCTGIETSGATTADAQGRYRFEFPAESACALSARADGYVPALGPERADVQGSARMAGGEAVVGPLLFRSARLEGRVVADGRPVAEARVSLGYREAPGEAGPVAAARAAVSDAEGRFGFEALVPGRVVVEATAPGLPRGGSGAVLLASGVTARVEVDLSGTARIEGEVRAPGGVSVAHYPVGLRGPVERGTTTDAKGRFSFATLHGGRYVLETRSARGEGSARRSIELAEGAREQVLVVVTPARAVRGVVRAPSGAPVPAALVMEAPADALDGEAEETRADGAGAFALWVADGGARRLRAFHADFAPSDPVEATPDGDAVTLTLHAAARVTGRAVARDGVPLSDARAEARPAATDGVAARSTPGENAGEFTLGPLPAGGFDILVRASGHLPLVVRAVTVVEGGAVDLGDVVLDRGGYVEGRVHEQGDDAPLAGVVVAAEGLPAALYSAAAAPRVLTDSDGHFRLGPLPEGEAALRFTRLGYEVARRVARVPSVDETAASEDVVLVRRAAPPPDAHANATPGIGIRARAGRLGVSAVGPRSAAAEAGIVPGARLVSVDGYPVDDLPPETVARLLLGARGSSARVEAVLPGQTGAREFFLERR